MTLWDPVQRYSLEFEQDGDDIEMEVELHPGGGVPAHTHPSQVERFEILAGRVEFLRGAEKVVAGPGDEVVVPAGVKHAFEHVEGEPARFRCRVSPGLNLVAFFEDSSAAARAGMYNRHLVPLKPRAPIVMAGILERYGDEVQMAFPPKPLQALLKPLARFDKRDA